MLRVLKGDTLGIASTSSSVAPDIFFKGVRQLENFGFKAFWDINPFMNYESKEGGFSTCSAAKRAKSLEDLFVNKDISGIIAARGGYGATELLPLLDYKKIGEHKKIFVGYSDVSVLLLNLYKRSGIPSIHGGTIGAEFSKAEESKYSRESVKLLVKMITDESFRVFLKGESLRSGEGKGKLIVSNLTMLLTLLGTSWDVSYDNSILVIEDVGEAPYRVRRSLVQLKQAGKLDKLKGVLFGRFSRILKKEGLSIKEVIEGSLKDIFLDTSYPILYGVEVGHNGLNVPLPLGCEAQIRDNCLFTLESPICG